QAGRGGDHRQDVYEAKGISHRRRYAPAQYSSRQTYTACRPRTISRLHDRYPSAGGDGLSCRSDCGSCLERRHWRPTSLVAALLGGDADGGPSPAFAKTAVLPVAGVALSVGGVACAVAVGQVVAPFAVVAAPSA